MCRTALRRAAGRNTIVIVADAIVIHTRASDLSSRRALVVYLIEMCSLLDLVLVDVSERPMGPPPRASRRGAADERRLGLFHAFGSQSDAGALLLDDRTVLHRCGRWLVAQEIDQVAIPTELSPMSFFFEMASDMERLTAMCLSENRRHLALCEVCDASSSSPQVRIVHVPTRRRPL